MEKILRKKFIIFSISAVAAVLILLVAVVNIANYVRVKNQIDDVLEQLSSGNEVELGNWLENYNSGLSVLGEYYLTRYFVVHVDDNGEIISITTENVNLITAEEALVMGTEALDSGHDTGTSYGYSYCTITTPTGSKLIFIDTSQQYALCNAFLSMSLIVCTIVLVAVSAVLILVADKVVAPIADSHNKQKQFVTNITHEFKTPLAIIKANTEVSEMVGEQTQWTESTHHQIERLNKLVNNLLYLAKQQEDVDVVKVMSPLSQMVETHSEPFVALAGSVGRTLSIDIEPNIDMRCDAQAVDILVSILLENAVKYSSEGGHINLSLARNRDGVTLLCSNSVDNIEVGNYSRWLDRFYKQDESRTSSSNSFGIGLSTAQAIVDNHDGKISVYSDDGKVVNVKIDFTKHLS